MVFKIITSLVFIAVFIARIVKPEWNIDTTSIILLILAFVPWFIQYIKTLEISGLGKVELVGKEQKKEIDKKKINKFQITYEEGEFFYLASGYGERPSFGYNIKVNDLYSKGDVLYLDTTLTGPEEGAVVKKAPSYPFIVIKLKASGTDKKVEFIM